MAGKFEWQFKYRDEADVNASARGASAKFRKSLIAGTSAIRQIRFTLRSWDIDNHRARWRVSCAAPPSVVTRNPATPRLRRGMRSQAAEASAKAAGG